MNTKGPIFGASTRSRRGVICGLAVLVIHSVLTPPAQAQVFKCKDDRTGQIAYSQTPCHGSASGGRVKIQENSMDTSGEMAQAARLSAKRMREDREREVARAEYVARLRAERTASERAETARECADVSRRYDEAKNRQASPDQMQKLKNTRRAACGMESEPVGMAGSPAPLSMPAPTPAPSVITSCDASGCWDNMGGRYNKGAGQTYIPAQGGGHCQMVGGMMRCP